MDEERAGRATTRKGDRRPDRASHRIPRGATRPRYTVTDTGQTSELLDLAQQVWPEVTDRRELLLRLTRAGGLALQSQLADEDARRERQRVGLQRAAQLVASGLRPARRRRRVALILLDKSAWVRGGATLLDYGELCMCAITRLEILYSARSAADYLYAFRVWFCRRNTGVDGVVM
jgi:hypothetical protein